MLPKRHFNRKIADPVGYSINALSIFKDIELSYNKKVVATAHVCSEESASATFSRTVAKVAPLYGTIQTENRSKKLFLLNEAFSILAKICDHGCG